MLKRRLYWLAIGLALSPLTIAQLAVEKPNVDCVDCQSKQVNPPSSFSGSWGSWNGLIQTIQGSYGKQEQPKYEPIAQFPFHQNLDFSWVPQTLEQLQSHAVYNQQQFNYSYPPVAPVMVNDQRPVQRPSQWMTQTYFNNFNNGGPSGYSGLFY